MDHCRAGFPFNSLLGNHGPEPSQRGHKHFVLGVFSDDDHRDIYLDAAFLAFQVLQKARLGGNHGNEDSGTKTINKDNDNQDNPTSS